MKICIECGKEVAELYDGLCRECYIKSHAFTDLPRRIYLTTCPKCGRVRYKNSWREESIDNAIRKAIKGSLT
ncbi:MAG: NMD protein affecting ribosome stability and mRNA decay, partial [Thermoplasmata archaeon]